MYKTQNANSNTAYEQKNISIDSNKRLDGSSNISDFRHSTSLPRDYDYDRVTCLVAEIPKAYYMLDSSTLFVATEDPAGTPVNLDVIIPGGRNYTSTELAAQLKTSLDAASVIGGNSYTYTVAFSFATGKLTVTCSVGEFQMGFVTGQSDDYSNLARYLGFALDGPQLSSSSVLVSPQMVNLQRYNCLYIRSNIANNAGDDILATVYVGSSIDLSMIKYVTPSATRHSVGLSDSVAECSNFSLTDENGKLINMHGINWRLVIQCFKSGQEIN